jgi:hypothetical protein
MFPLRVAGAEDTAMGGTANVRSLLTVIMPEMDDGTVVDRGVAFCRGVGTLPITATSTITVIAITEVVMVTIVATETTEATASEESIHPNGFTSEPIVAGEMWAEYYRKSQRCCQKVAFLTLLNLVRIMAPPLISGCGGTGRRAGLRSL